jgi:glycosyltransferase involved in cell wall biosynthesis
MVEKWQKEGYLELLSSNLECRGISVVGPDEPRARFDILHLHAPHYQGGIRFWTAALQALGPHPIVWTAHDVPKGDVDWRYEWTTRTLAKRAEVIFCHGDSSRCLLIDRFLVPPARIHVLQHPSFVGVFPHEVSRAEARRFLAIPHDAFVFLMLGNVRRTKGARRFLKALDRLGDRQSLVVVAGSMQIDREEATYLMEESRCRANLRLFPGEVPGILLQYFFSAADVAIFPYENITTSGAVHLAMSFCMPVLGADINCLGADIHPDGGVKYSPSEDQGLESAILQIRSMPESVLLEMGKRNLSRMAKWTFADFAQATEQHYKALHIA